MNNTCKLTSEYNYLGNIEILKEHKTAFLCSRKYSSDVVLETFDWATKMRDEGKCVISGFQSKLEKDVLQYLLKGKQSIIIILARALKQRLEPELKINIEKGRLLIISPFSEQVKRIIEENSLKRNNIILNLADEYYIPYFTKGGMLEKLLKEKRIIEDSASASML